jgi:LmbE family N-acetylglucosaminyl deacetylase/pimeloyl-ACP methyl ester carboxylesterase
MRNISIIVALLAFSLIGPRLAAQQIPAAVATDPPVDKQYPPGLSMFIVPSHGEELDAWLYVASGSGPHGTVILPHGLPGYEMSGDLAQSIRRAGWNVLLFHYRGTWGVPGPFSQSSAIEDTAEVVRFLREPVNVAKYRSDPKRLVFIGHSFGGFIAGYAAAHDPDIEAVAMIAAVNLGRINADPKEREARLKRWETQLHPVRGATAAELFAEAERHAKEWDYVQWADALRTRPVLLLEADDQNHADMKALTAALQQKSAVALTHIAVQTDHSFSDHRVALQSIVIEWLEKLKKPSSQARAPKTLVGVWAHVDDDATVAPVLARYAREGTQVYTIIATDGSQGCKHTTIPCGSELARARSEEARCACDALGIHPPILLGFPDGKLGDYVGDPSLMLRLTQQVAEELRKVHADAVITWGPDGGTGHPDHRIVSDVVTQLVRAGAPGAPEQLFYAYLPPQAEVLPPLLLPQKKYFTVQVPVTSSDYDAFRRAMACHKTQFSAEELKRVAAAPLSGPVRLVPAFSTDTATDLFEPLR